MINFDSKTNNNERMSYKDKIEFLRSLYYRRSSHSSVINYNLIKKHPLENWSNEYRNKYLNDVRTRYKMVLIDSITDFSLTVNQKSECEKIIRQLDFNELDRSLSNEQILTMIALYVRTCHNNYYRNYKYMLEKQNLNEQNYINFLTKLCVAKSI